jgi:biopolymer transport protein ExbD
MQAREDRRSRPIPTVRNPRAPVASKRGVALSISTGPAGRRSLDHEVNMVPFVDLLVSIIAFLVLTAAWNRLEQLDLEPRGGVDPVGAPATPAPVTRIGISAADVVVTDEVGVRQRVARRPDGSVDVVALSRALGALRATAGPERPATVVLPDDGVRYDAIVSVLDTVRAAGLRSPSLFADPSL